MKYAFVVFVRNKAPWISKCVQSVLAQTYSPMELIFSDQGSTDDTLEIIKKTVNGYNGPNKVRILECPDTEPKGMRGLMAHINWLANNIDADYWITLSGDDISYPDRAKRTVETIRDLDRLPLFFGTRQHFVTEGEWDNAGVTAHPNKSGWVKPIESLSDKVGGSVSGAWSAEALDLFGPLADHALIDVYLPFCSALLDRFYYLHEIHHAYVERPDPENTGLQGYHRMMKTDEEKEQVRELTMFQLAANMILMTQVAQGFAEGEIVPKSIDMDETLHYLYSGLLAQLGGWVETRQSLTVQRIRPMALPA